MEKPNGLKVITLNMSDMVRQMENAIQFGDPVLIQDVQEEIDPILEPVLSKSFIKKGNNSLTIKLGDKEVDYSPDFKLYLTSKLFNPHYTPEVSTKVTIVNFAVKEQGLEAQLLNIVVKMERPDLDEEKNDLVKKVAQGKRTIAELEDTLLDLLSNARVAARQHRAHQHPQRLQGDLRHRHGVPEDRGEDRKEDRGGVVSVPPLLCARRHPVLCAVRPRQRRPDVPIFARRVRGSVPPLHRQLAKVGQAGRADPEPQRLSHLRGVQVHVPRIVRGAQAVALAADVRPHPAERQPGEPRSGASSSEAARCWTARTSPPTRRRTGSASSRGTTSWSSSSRCRTSSASPRRSSRVSWTGRIGTATRARVPSLRRVCLGTGSPSATNSSA